MDEVYRILLVEDDPGIGKTVDFNLKDEGFEVLWAKCLQEAHELYAENSFHLVLLDIGLPDGSGFDFCKAVREQNDDVTIFILTATIEEESAIRSFNLGADDYIRKPFGMEELIAKVKRLYQKDLNVDKKLVYEDLTVYPGKRQAFCGDLDLELSRREFDLLYHFVSNPEKVISREEFLDKLTMDSDANDRTIDSHVSHLRSMIKKKVKKPLHAIRSVYGVGYKLGK